MMQSGTGRGGDVGGGAYAPLPTPFRSQDSRDRSPVLMMQSGTGRGGDVGGGAYAPLPTPFRSQDSRDRSTEVPFVGANEPNALEESPSLRDGSEPSTESVPGFQTESPRVASPSVPRSVSWAVVPVDHISTDREEPHAVVVDVPRRERSGGEDDCDVESPPQCDPLLLLFERSQSSCESLDSQFKLTRTADVTTDQLGITTVNDYVIGDCLGAGACGVVHLARGPGGKLVAIKCIKGKGLGLWRAPSIASSSELHGGDGHRSSSFAHNPVAGYVRLLLSNNDESCPASSNAELADDLLYLDYSILKEVAIMKHANNNKHIVRLHEAILDPAQTTVYLIMQFVGGDSILEKSYSAAAAFLHISNAEGTPLSAASHRDVSEGSNSSASPPSSFRQAQGLPRVSSESLFDSSSSSTASVATAHLANEPAQIHDQRQRNALWAKMAAAGEVVFKALPKATIIIYTGQIVSALFSLDKKGIVHRDIKPDNLLLDVSKNNVYLADFGVSEICNGDMTGDVGRVLIGTPFYMAPELFDASNKKLAGAVDIWALGVTIYAMATGRLPFVGGNESEVRFAVLETESEYPSDLDEGLAALIKKMLRKDPGERISIQVLFELITPAANPKKHIEIVDEMALTSSFAAAPPFTVDENNTLGTAVPPEFDQVVPNPRGRGLQATGHGPPSSTKSGCGSSPATLIPVPPAELRCCGGAGPPRRSLVVEVPPDDTRGGRQIESLGACSGVQQVTAALPPGRGPLVAPGSDSDLLARPLREEFDD